MAPSECGQDRRAAVDATREQLVAYLSRLDATGSGKISREQLAALMKKLRVDERDISTMVRWGEDLDGLIDYRRFVAWLFGDRGEVDRALATSLIRDVRAELADAASPSQDRPRGAPPDWSLEDVLGRSLAPILVDALAPEPSASVADWQAPFLEVLARQGGAERALQELLGSRRVLESVAAKVAGIARAFAETGEVENARGRSMTSKTNRTNKVSQAKSTHDGHEKGQFVGSYGALVAFIRRCHADGCDPLSDEEFDKLFGAIESLSRHSSGDTVTKDHAHFTGYELTAVQRFLKSFIGGSASESESRACRTAECLDETIDLPSLSSGAMPTDAELPEVYSSFDFDQRGRNDVRADLRMLCHMFIHPDNMMARYHLQQPQLLAWMEEIARLYNANPYHNWKHAVDVTQFSYVALTRGGGGNFLNHQDMLALLFAQIAHDVGHTGTNNAFLVRTRHELALTYNDISPLEMMHASTLFRTLQQEGRRCLAGLAQNEYENVRGKIITCILATDMAKHFEFVDRFAARVSKTEDDPFTTGTKEDRERQKQSKADRRMLMQAFIHMADLGHCCRPWQIHKHLVVALEDEFFLQGDQESILGVPVMPMMNRNSDSLATGQEFFAAKLVTPLLEPYTHFLLPEVSDELFDNLAKNTEEWKKLIEKKGKLTARELVAIEDA